MPKREPIEWRDIWVTGAQDDSLPRLLLVGDSIARSYFVPVETALKGIFLCARLTTSTCVCDRAIEKELALLLDDYRFAVIHVNNGLHGLGYDEASYAKGLRRVLDFITKHSPHSKLIWANSTPQYRGGDYPNELDPRTERIRERNRMARDIVIKRNLPINDLFGRVVDHPGYFSEDGTHFTPNGQSILGKQVAQIVLKESNR